MWPPLNPLLFVGAASFVLSCGHLQSLLHDLHASVDSVRVFLHVGLRLQHTHTNTHNAQLGIMGLPHCYGSVWHVFLHAM